jgi:hypothetical protein
VIDHHEFPQRWPTVAECKTAVDHVASERAEARNRRDWGKTSEQWKEPTPESKARVEVMMRQVIANLKAMGSKPNKRHEPLPDVSQPAWEARFGKPAKPQQPIDKGLPGPGLLAQVITSKYSDHLPLHRLERVYERQGLFIPRSTLCDWLAACGHLLQQLYHLLVSVALQSRALHTDDTTVKLQDPATHRLSTARLWAYLGDAAHPVNVFDFTLNRKRDGPRQFLATYKGYLHADAFSGYDCLYLPDPLAAAAARIVEVACNAHARRKFYEARTSDPERAHVMLAWVRGLYDVEDQAKQERLRHPDLMRPAVETLSAEKVEVRSSLDNLKRTVMRLAPDWLFLSSAGGEIESAWAVAAEEAADDHAAGPDRSGSLDLAGALLKASRLTLTSSGAFA